MLKRLLQFTVTSKSHCFPCTLSQLVPAVQKNSENTQEIGGENSLSKTQGAKTKTSLFDPLSEDISHVSTFLKPTFNFAAYANKSDTIQEFVNLGVDLHYIEKKNSKAVPFILGLTFDVIKEHIIFFNQLGLKNEEIASVITKNPFIFREDLENLNVRITYLKFKKFTDEMIAIIISKNPFWLSYSTKDVDKKLGFFQKNFKLSGNEIRFIATKKPQLITYDDVKLQLNMFVVKEEMGFGEEEMKQIVLKSPSVFIMGQHRILKTFEYLHNVMKIPHERIVQTAEVLTCRVNRLKERHQFLVKLGRDQYNPKEPNYIALSTLIKDTDANFATEIAKSSVQAFNLFLKTF